ncbi:hypothetical protein [Nostoc flagelliforme]|nr:hypothetical protein [Nostoc flagelliforme]
MAISVFAIATFRDAPRTLRTLREGLRQRNDELSDIYLDSST